MHTCGSNQLTSGGNEFQPTHRCGLNWVGDFHTQVNPGLELLCEHGCIDYMYVCMYVYYYNTSGLVAQ